MTEPDSRAAPRWRGNLYSNEAISDPHPVYATLRELGPVVWLSKHKAFALTTYAACKSTLLDDATFESGHGVAMNPLTNRMSRGTTLNSDGDEHARRRKLLAHRLMPRSLRVLNDDINATAARVVDEALAKPEVDGVADLARALPLRVVPDLVGWPKESREHLLAWAAATFDVLGPLNRTSAAATPASLAMLRFARRTVRRRDVLPGSMGAEVLAALDEGLVTRKEAAALLVDYLAPSLDTTISAVSSALRLFAEHPDQWARLQQDPSLAANAFNEVVRIESPLRAFSRRVRTDTAVEGVSIPAGSRVVVLYASANRDERYWDNPDVFDIHRDDATRHLGFGHGTHGCAGQGLARMEGEAMFRALLERVERIELAGEPVWGHNNIIHGLGALPLRLIKKKADDAPTR